jgi:predicted TIM-barrel enzyme
VDGITWNPVDPGRARELMHAVHQLRAGGAGGVG